jgi:hypothetical protein
MLGPLEAVNGVLMLGMTSDKRVVILTQLIKGRRRALGLGDERGFLTRASCKALR